ncbi:MAG TPA: hypothetical protein VKR32_13775 [Puia sp.]|nr:hypothetical protein [Puia sp.]
MNIYVSNLGFSVQDADLKRLFTEFGTVDSAKVIIDRETGQSLGFGFVQLSNDTAALKAIQVLDGKLIAGRTIEVNEAREKKRDRSHSSRRS